MLLIVLVGGLLLLVLTAFLIRWSGFSRAQQLIADLRATGYLPNDKDLLASLPDITIEGQKNLHRAVEQLSRKMSWVDLATTDQASLAWITTDRVMPQHLRTKVDDGRELFSEIRAALRVDGVILGSAQYLADHLASGRKGELPTTDNRRVGAVSHYLRLASLAGEAKALDDFDVMKRATRYPIRWGDWFDRFLFDIRDQTYIDLALLDRLDPVRAEVWLAEQQLGLREMAQCMRFDLNEWIHDCERQGLQAGVSVFASQRRLSELSDVPEVACGWLFGGSDVAAYINLRKTMADKVEAHGATLPESPETFRTDMGALQGLFFAQQCPPGLTAFAVRHRLMRLATRIIFHYRLHGFLPDNATALKAICGEHALDPVGLCPGLFYVRNEEQGFRIAVDPRSPHSLRIAQPRVWFHKDMAPIPPLRAGYSDPTRTITADELIVRIPERNASTPTSPAPPGDPPRP